MKKVLLLSGSHRKNGNSDLLCDQFMLGAKESGHQAEKIIIRDKKINYCLACDACKRNGGTCVQKDDMNEILDKMMAAEL
jgi:multimeric flavodoxin WrbA